MSVKIGFSVNPEVLLQREGGSVGDKHNANISVQLGGASAIAAGMIKQLGGDPQLFAFIGPDNDPFSLLLRHCSISSGMQAHFFEVLKQTSRAVITVNNPHSTVDGHKGVPRSVTESGIGDILSDIRSRANGSFVVAGSVRLDELVFAEALLQGAPQGKRFLHLHYSFCGHNQVSKVTHLADIMVLNEKEFNRWGCSLETLHAMGPRAIVVTKAEEGGVCSFAGGITFAYDAVLDYRESFVTDTGAGDSFNGAFVHAMIQMGMTADDLGHKDCFQRVVRFASDAAAQKVAFGEIRYRHTL